MAHRARMLSAVINASLERLCGLGENEQHRNRLAESTGVAVAAGASAATALLRRAHSLDRCWCVRFCCVYVHSTIHFSSPNGTKNGEVVFSPSSRSRIGSTLFLDHTKTSRETPRHRHRQPVFYNSSLRLTVKRALNNLRKRHATKTSARLCFCNAAAGTVCRGPLDYSGWEEFDECKMVESSMGARKWDYRGPEKNGSDRTAYAPTALATRYASSARPFSSVPPFPSSVSSPASRASCSSRPSASSSPTSFKKKVDAASCGSVPRKSGSCIRVEDRRQGEEKSTATANLHMVDERTNMREEHSTRYITNDDSQLSRDETERTHAGCSELLHNTEKSHGEAPLRKRSASQENITANGGESSDNDKDSERNTVSRHEERKSPLQDGRTGDAVVCVQLEGSSGKRELQDLANDAFRRSPSRATPASQPTKHQILLRLVIEDCRGPVA